MIIKKLVVGSMFSMLLGSEMAAAAWGDMYYCQMTNLVDISIKGEKKNYKLERFQLKLDQTKNAMVFGNKGYFKYKVIELDSSVPSHEMWFARDRFTNTNFTQGKFLHTSNGSTYATIISADCEIF